MNQYLLKGILLLVTGTLACSSATNRTDQEMVKKNRDEVVVTYQEPATQVGQQVLKNGGNAFDAFIASTLVQYVIGEGVTSAAGPLQAVLYDTKSEEIVFLDGGFNNVKNPEGRWSAADPKPGKAIVVPGAIRALEALSKRYGKLSFADCVKPAFELARDGFLVTPMYAISLKMKAPLLQSSEYGRRTFFKNGEPLKAGDMIKLPEAAGFLSGIMKEGADHMYKGDWAKKTVALVQKLGGKMTIDDLASYQATFNPPLKINYRGFDIYGPSGRSFGGAWVALALKILENWHPDPKHHYSESAQDLESLIRVANDVEQVGWIYKADVLDDPAMVQSKLDLKHAKALWDHAQSNPSPGSDQPLGTHSYHVIVVDRDGNAITGTNTIQAMPWADGYFIEGIPLNNAGSLADSLYYGTPGGRRLSALSMHLVFKKDQLRFATGSFHSSLMPGELQFLVNLIDYGKSTHEAVMFPRFGNMSFGQTPRRNSVSPRISSDIIRTLQEHGVSTQPATKTNHLDTGLGDVAIIHDDGSKEGAFAPLLQW